MSAHTFHTPLINRDPVLVSMIEEEARRQSYGLEMIASENFVSKAVMEAQGSCLTNKYAEGYPKKRYYGGCAFVDQVEELAVQRAQKLFHAEYVNVQPHAGSQANAEAFFALLNPGDRFMGLNLSDGGHLTHGAKPSFSGKWFEPVPYRVHPQTCLLDYEAIEETARTHKPKLIIAGFSAYPRKTDYKAFRGICDRVGALLMVDMAHVAGIIAAEEHPSPLPYADVVTTTTHKTLRGPRGGMILTNNPEIGKKIAASVFPGMQGGPLMHVIAAKAVAFEEALQPEFKTHIQAVLSNAKALGRRLEARRYALSTGGTDTHLLVVDLRRKHITGNIAEKALEEAGITCNKNAIPYDTEKYTKTSGIRLGTPALTSRGMGEADMETIADGIADVLDSLSDGADSEIRRSRQKVRAMVETLCRKYPLYL